MLMGPLQLHPYQEVYVSQKVSCLEFVGFSSHKSAGEFQPGNDPWKFEIGTFPLIQTPKKNTNSFYGKSIYCVLYDINLRPSWDDWPTKSMLHWWKRSEAWLEVHIPPWGWSVMRRLKTHRTRVNPGLPHPTISHTKGWKKPRTLCAAEKRLQDPSRLSVVGS